MIIAFQACGVKTLAEHATADGYIDLVLEQIEDKEYYQPFIHSGKKIRLLGINFYRTTQTEAGKKAHFTVTVESRLHNL